MWSLYQIVYALLLIVSGPFLLLRRGGHYLESLPRRLGLRRAASARRGALWIHAVSVGEVGVAATLAKRLETHPLLVTTITPTGQARARELFGDRVAVDYLPFELGPAIRSFLGRHAPASLVLTEGDYWPLLLHHVDRRRLPIVVVNGRVGDRSFERLRRFAAWRRPLLGPIRGFGVQTEEDRRRLLALGVDADRVTVTGNLKFEAPEPPRLEELESVLLSAAGERPMLVAGSTMRNEEPMVLDAFAAAGGGDAAMLLLAPRHPERWDEVARAVAERGLALRRRSELAAADRPAVVLLDTMGELASIYRLATAAFVGGTLVPTGGHTPLEAARFGVAIACGQSMENFRAMAEQFDRAEAWCRVVDAAELGAVWRAWIERPELAGRVGGAAADLVAANRGAVERTLELLRRHAILVGEGAGSHDGV